MSEMAKKVAGTFVPDEAQKLPNTLAWATSECREGRLAPLVRQFCEGQPEILDASLVLVEQVSSDALHCRIPCRCFDHESAATFPVDVRFTLNPRTGHLHRAA
jgi:hypothetical protein